MLIGGASGFVGSALAPHLERAGHQVVRLVRREARAAGEVSWDPERGVLDPEALAEVDGVVNLSGATIARRWTDERKREIWSSRVSSTRLLAKAIAAARPRQRVFVSMSATGWYGDRGDESLTEASGPGAGWLVRLAQEWERAAEAARAAGVRVVHPRMGLVVGPGGGVLAPLELPFRLGVGGPIGDGRAWWSWVALDDTVAAIERMLADDRLEGAVNLVAPEPVRNADFARVLGRVMGRPAAVPVPAFALKLLFGEAADEALLASTRVLPARLIASGYEHRLPELDAAIRRALEPSGPRA